MPPGADASLDVRVLLADGLLRASRSIGIGPGRSRIGFIAPSAKGHDRGIHGIRIGGKLGFEVLETVVPEEIEPIETA